MTDFGATPLSDTTVGANQFPVSAAFVPGTAGGALTAVEGIAINTDVNGYRSTAFRIGLLDGDDVTLGHKADAKSSATDTTAITAMQVLKQISFMVQNPASTPVTGTFWQATQPISASSLPLPAGASTSAKQPALGTAGSASADVLTVQGVASMVALKVDGSAVTQQISGTITANIGTTNGLALDATVAKLNVAQAVALGSNTGPLVQGSVTTASPTYTTGNVNPLSLTTAGALRVDASAVTQPVSGTVTANAGIGNFQTQLVDSAGINVAGVDSSHNVLVKVNVALPTGANTIGAVTQASGPWTQNITQFGSNNVATGTGASGTGIPRVTVSNDSEVQIWDGTNGPVAAKAARTPPTLADISHVHSISPNNTGLPVNLSSIVQSTNNKSSGSVASLAKAFTSNNIQGNSIIVVCAIGNGTAPTISDTAGNTYTQAAQSANGTALNVAVFYAVGIAGGANTVTVNNGGTTASIAMEIYEVSGLLALVPAQPSQTATATGNSGTAATASVSAASPNEYAFASVGVGTAAQTVTAGSGWTNDSGQQNPTTPAGLFSFISMSQFLGSLKSVTPQATFTSEPWAIAVATFRPVVLGVEGTMEMAQSATGTPHSNVASSASDVQLLAANPNRKAVYVYNDSTAILYLALGTTAASTTNYLLQIPAQGFYEVPVYPTYTGIVRGIWSAANGNARITELT